ncbi:hypothetical protein TPHA_0A04980 [Tetrapisispora phaffii CBS 4417]|uniref:Large ribosomal subunit protein uL3m n=1 Tax=Tetrapisispora phaffii (strain ATCC 24235 / CBS 4417 / NBRC 1672 / NRRL Y-8282 / UCD 70-5) TaxID=1071381 RepID=G8BNU5_TETPH|nr:mitochondrial 54S ribosomal protein YmL9 TPHA_0A04980 [Tetrapisispora phaffii CBS 4417]CCE61573.1 hypothetical protein TPHA_0A04980 [Tetrapisispora phaffii CBS 4417]
MSSLQRNLGLWTTIRNLSSRSSLVAPSIANSIHLEDPKINHSPEKAILRKWLPKRCGAITQKKVMMPYFDPATGNRIAATVLQFNNVEVMMHKTVKDHGYFANQVGFGDKNPKKISRQMLGHFAKTVVNPKDRVAEFRVKDESGLLPLNTLIKPSFFTPGQYIDIKSVSKGKGFAGVMKRHHFKGLRASHGTSIMHRHGGSFGQNQDPGRVLPGKKMPGRMGGKNTTIQNSQVLKIDDENNVLLVKGPVSGPKGSYVKIQDAIKKPPTI